MRRMKRSGQDVFVWRSTRIPSFSSRKNFRLMKPVKVGRELKSTRKSTSFTVVSPRAREPNIHRFATPMARRSPSVWRMVWMMDCLSFMDVGIWNSGFVSRWEAVGVVIAVPDEGV